MRLTAESLVDGGGLQVVGAVQVELAVLHADQT